MKIIFDDYETVRTELPMAPVNTAPEIRFARRSTVAPGWINPRAETRLFHAWRA